MNPAEFQDKWRPSGSAELTERSAAQQHFLDLCELLDHPKPADVDPKGELFTFEKGAAKRGGSGPPPRARPRPRSDRPPPPRDSTTFGRHSGSRWVLLVMEPAIKHRYIVRDDRILGGEPIVEGTRTPVRAVAELWRLGLQPDEIVRRLPHLTLAQAFDALSYYSDHQQEVNGFIERNRIAEEKTDPLVRGA